MDSNRCPYIHTMKPAPRNLTCHLKLGAHYHQASGLEIQTTTSKQLQRHSQLEQAWIPLNNQDITIW